MECHLSQPTSAPRPSLSNPSPPPPIGQRPPVSSTFHTKQSPRPERQLADHGLKSAESEWASERFDVEISFTIFLEFPDYISLYLAIILKMASLMQHFWASLLHMALIKERLNV